MPRNLGFIHKLFAFVFLKRFEINGFKSFAKATMLEFPAAISAIVGPNGSGKSNIAEALRWVLGEQSLKHLRGKRGEDLIFSGSPGAARLSKACAALAFDNSGRHFPLPYQEITVGRCVWRDGTSEYSINQSPARLKDVLELLAHIGLGASQHHIIGQGEADRMLYASARERQGMIEEALGLRIFQLKRMDAERKLAHARRNQDETEHLQKEIRPHLRFLKRQVERYAQADQMRSELRERGQTYFFWLGARVREGRAGLSERKGKPQEALKILEKRIAEARAALQQSEKGVGGEPATAHIEQKLEHLRARRVTLERERGRQEGLAEARRVQTDKTAHIQEGAVKEFLDAVEQHIKNALERSLLEEVHQVLKSLHTVAGAFRK
ncbi:MAG: AAA family ATPase, partial [Parcubacteria group bacterium]|nr:AAA family ATPase [Parcubacteria group bacterium]